MQRRRYRPVSDARLPAGATDPFGDVERDLVGGAVERGADAGRGAVGRRVAVKRRVSTRLPPAVDSEPS